MNRSNTSRFIALIASAGITFSVVVLMATYAYPEGTDAQLATSPTLVAPPGV